VASDVDYAEMFRVYDRSRLAPNESILDEVNFRLLETVSCGCLSLGPDVGPDQDVLFDPGREIETYSHVLELQAKLDYYLTRPDKAEAMARAAWTRLRREHLPVHRAMRVVELAQTLPAVAARGSSAKQAHCLARCTLGLGGQLDVDWPGLARELDRLEPTPEVLAARLRTLLLAGTELEAARLLDELLGAKLFPDDLELGMAASLSALRLGRRDMARRFWLRRELAMGVEPPRLPETPASLCLFWAAECKRTGRAFSPGKPFDPTRHVPDNGLDCLAMAQDLEPNAPELRRATEELMAGVKGAAFVRLGMLSDRTLREPENWRLGLAKGLLDLACFRRDQGLEELLLAREAARRQDRERAFLRALAGQDLDGSILAALGRLTPPPRNG